MSNQPPRIVMVAARFAEINDQTVTKLKRQATLQAEHDKLSDELEELSKERAKLTLEMVSLTQG